MALFFNGQCRLANSKYYFSQTTKCKIQFDCDVKAMKIKLNGNGWFPQVTWFYTLPLIGHNLLLVYYQVEYKGNFYKYSLYYTWVQMLLQIGPSLRLGSKCYYGWDFYYAWVQMLLQMGPLLHLGPLITLVPSTSTSLISAGGKFYPRLILGGTSFLRWLIFLFYLQFSDPFHFLVNNAKAVSYDWFKVQSILRDFTKYSRIQTTLARTIARANLWGSGETVYRVNLVVRFT